MIVVVGGIDDAESTEILNLNDQGNGWTLLEGPNQKIGYFGMQSLTVSNNLFIFGWKLKHVHCILSSNICILSQVARIIILIFILTPS